MGREGNLILFSSLPASKDWTVNETTCFQFSSSEADSHLNFLYFNECVFYILKTYYKSNFCIYNMQSSTCIFTSNFVRCNIETDFIIDWKISLKYLNNSSRELLSFLSRLFPFNWTEVVIFPPRNELWNKWNEDSNH